MKCKHRNDSGRVKKDLRLKDCAKSPQKNSYLLLVLIAR